MGKYGVNIEKEKTSSMLSDVYNVYHLKLKNYINRYIHNEHISEELMQDIFLNIIRKSTAVDYTNPAIYKYLIIIAKNAIKDYYKHHETTIVINQTHIEEIDQNIFDEKFQNILNNIELEGKVISTLNETLNQFSNIEKEVFLKVTIDNLSKRKASIEYSLTPYQINSIMNKIRFQIKKNINIQLQDL